MAHRRPPLKNTTYNAFSDSQDVPFVTYGAEDRDEMAQQRIDASENIVRMIQSKRTCLIVYVKGTIIWGT